MTAARRVFFVGTDTGVGKTELLCELLARATSLGVRALPYKPAQSREPGAPSDADRLLAASSLPGLTLEQLVAFDFSIPIAPGMADAPARFLQHPSSDPAPLARCLAHLAEAIAFHSPELVLIEGAGGLWVPMPGGTWLPQWILATASAVVIVARAGLGTINHTLCVIDALRSLGLEPLGFYFCETEPPDPSALTNAEVITSARGTPHLGTLPYRRPPTTCLLTALLSTTPA